MEQLLHYVWKHRLFPLRQLATTDGQPVEVIDPGLQNRNAGPDFFNAKMKIGGMMWVGNVELHSRSSEWYQHGHDSDKAYDNVVLHVVEQADTEVVTSSGRTLPQMVVEIPENVVANYRQLTAAESRPPCHDTVASMPALRLHSWLSALQMERLEQKTTAIESLLKTYGGSWDDVFFCTLARSFGFGVNSEAFETWARTIPLMQVGHHRDDIFQVEAFFLGQAGLLSPDSLPRLLVTLARLTMNAPTPACPLTIKSATISPSSAAYTRTCWTTSAEFRNRKSKKRHKKIRYTPQEAR